MPMELGLAWCLLVWSRLHQGCMAHVACRACMCGNRQAWPYIHPCVAVSSGAPPTSCATVPQLAPCTLATARLGSRIASPRRGTALSSTPCARYSVGATIPGPRVRDRESAEVGTSLSPLVISASSKPGTTNGVVSPSKPARSGSHARPNWSP